MEDLQTTAEPLTQGGDLLTTDQLIPPREAAADVTSVQMGQPSNLHLGLLVMGLLKDVVQPEGLCSRTALPQIGGWTLAVCLALPHFLYAFIWFKPDAWRQLFKRSSVDAFALAGAVGKVLQFTALLLWFSSSRDSGLCLDWSLVTLSQWLLFLLLTCLGQSLNYGIFKAIGKAGVYYGFKLGSAIPWHNGYPFNMIRHPQYVGSVLSIWGLVALVWGQSPPDTLVYALYWTLIYVVTGVWEDCC